MCIYSHMGTTHVYVYGNCLFIFFPKLVLCSYVPLWRNIFFFLYGAGNKLTKTQELVGFITVWHLFLEKDQSRHRIQVKMSMQEI